MLSTHIGIEIIKNSTGEIHIQWEKYSKCYGLNVSPKVSMLET